MLRTPTLLLRTGLLWAALSLATVGCKRSSEPQAAPKSSAAPASTAGTPSPVERQKSPDTSATAVHLSQPATAAAVSAPLPATSTPVTSLHDARRLLDLAADQLRPLVTGADVWAHRSVGASIRRERITAADGQVEHWIPSLQLVRALSPDDRRCSVRSRVSSPAAPPVSGPRCKSTEAAEIDVVAAFWASVAMADGRLPDARVEAITVTANGRPSVRLSTRKANVRWWLQFDQLGRQLVGLQTARDGTIGRLERTAKFNVWRLRVDSENRGLLDFQPADSGSAGDQPRFLRVPLGPASDGGADPLEMATKRLFAIASSRSWVAVGPVGLAVRWDHQTVRFDAAVLPVLGAMDGTPNVHESAPGDAIPIHFSGREMSAGFITAKVAPGCYFGLILGELASGERTVSLLPTACGSAG